MPILEFGKLLFQLLPIAIKGWQLWQEHHQQALTSEHRKKLAADIKTVVDNAIATKSTAGIEDAIKNLGRPQTVPAETPKAS